MAEAAEIPTLINSHPEGHPLQQAFYCDPEIFSHDASRLFTKLWHPVGHASRIPNAGDYFLFNMGSESLIIVRETEARISALFNVCRHRGSRVCLQEEGNAKRFSCPYHAWTYKLDGSLTAASLMPPAFDKGKYGLHKAHVKVIEGLIFVNLADGDPPDIDQMAADLEPMLRFHGVRNAKVAERRHYPTPANWKLVVENFLECYHCPPAHPEYCKVHPPLAILAMGAGPNSGPPEAMEKYAPIQEAWEQRARELGHPVENTFGGNEHGQEWAVLRMPIQEGFLSETMDGKPASTLMGKFKEYDGGTTYFSFNSLSALICANDFCVLVQFIPRSVFQTDVFFTWLVDGSAQEGRDYDVEHMTEMWHATTEQDKTITTNNQLGVLSSRYIPGPYSEHEKLTASFINWYKEFIS